MFIPSTSSSNTAGNCLKLSYLNFLPYYLFLRLRGRQQDLEHSRAGAATENTGSRITS